MTIAELFGVLTAIAGLYLALNMSDSDQPLRIGPLRVTSGVSAGIFTVTGLLVLLASHTQPAAWWGEASNAIETAIFWCAAAASLAGAFGLIRAETPTGVRLATVVLAMGGTCLFGAVGDVVAASACLLVVGVVGWKLQSTPRTAHEDSPAEEPPAIVEMPAREPLLVTVTVLVLVWLLGSGIHMAVTSEARPSTRTQNPRALPRPYRGDADEAIESPETIIAEHDDESTWLTIAIGLLVTTTGVALLTDEQTDTSTQFTDEPAEAQS